MRDRKGRGGKTVTVIDGVMGSEAELAGALAPVASNGGQKLAHPPEQTDVEVSEVR